MIQLDNNATTRPTTAVVEAVTRALTECWHNPSSVHRAGQAARAAVELARQDVARLIGASPREVVFTSSGTESIDLAIRGVLAQTRKRTIVTSPVEHAAVRGVCASLEAAGWRVRHLPVDGEGLADAGALPALLDDDVALVSVQWVNNETGGIQAIGEIGRACRERGVVFHTDAVQWVGKAPTDVSDPDGPPVDLLSLSAHKFHGPKGVGALYVRKGVRLAPTMGGAQELGRRGGTENVPGILGAGAAAREAIAWLADDVARAALAQLRDRLERGLVDQIPGARINGPTDPARRLWGTTNISIPGAESERMLLALSERGVCASAGAACSSGSLEPSPVLLAMGLGESVAGSSIRLSLSRFTTGDEIERAIGLIARCAGEIAGDRGASGPGTVAARRGGA
ncbi:MAG: cysteine desulfurase family protein [Phycisphaerales bacterium]